MSRKGIMIDGYLVCRIAETEREEKVRVLGRNEQLPTDSLPHDHDFWLNSASGLWETPGSIVMSAFARGLTSLGKRLSHIYHKPRVAHDCSPVTQEVHGLPGRAVF